MTYAPVRDRVRYQSYQDYLNDESLSPDANYRLLGTGELIEVASEDDLNRRIAFRLLKLLLSAMDESLSECICKGDKEIQVWPVGDRCVNRKPNIMVLHPEHLKVARQAILLNMVPPLFVAGVVSPGSENSENHQRDYVWKRQQYQEWQILEYWIMDPHLEQVSVLTLMNEQYEETVYSTSEQAVSTVFPSLKASVQQLLAT